MTQTVFIRYQIDPYQRDAFEAYAKRWLEIIPACGGDVVGYWLPREGTNDIAWGLISFPSLAEYEVYRNRLRNDPDGAANFRFAQEQRFIQAEERTFLRQVELHQGWLSVPRRRHANESRASRTAQEAGPPGDICPLPSRCLAGASFSQV